MRSWYEETIASEKMYPHLFVISLESPNARKYNFKVCKRYCEEEKKLANALDKYCKLNENWWIKLDSCIYRAQILMGLGSLVIDH